MGYTATGRPMDLERLYRDESGRILATLIRLVGDFGLAEEVVQEAFVRAYERIGQFDPARPFGPWFVRSVVNAAVRAAEREGRLAWAPAADPPAEAGSGPEALAVAAENREALWAALGQLAPGQRAAVVLRYFLDLDVAESAARLGVPAGTLKRRLHDARRRLRALLAPALAGGPE